MTAITVTNVDWSILDAVRAAVAAATIGETAVFRSVTVTTADAQAEQCQFRDSPIAIVRYVTTVEDATPEDVRGCTVAMELTVAAWSQGAGPGESARLQEILRLKNAAVNAVEAAPPGDAHAWGGADRYHQRLQWGRPRIDAAVDRPWAVCRLPLEIGFVLDNGTSH
jgi:hypothetical protein